MNSIPTYDDVRTGGGAGGARGISGGAGGIGSGNEPSVRAIDAKILVNIYEIVGSYFSTNYEPVINKKIHDSEKKTKKISDQLLVDFSRRLNSSQIPLIEVLGLFVGLLTFLSFSVQIFSRINSLFSAGILILLFFGLISFMMLMMHITFRSLNGIKIEHAEKSVYICLLVFILILIFSPIYLLKDEKLNMVLSTPEFNQAVDTRIKETLKLPIQEKCVETQSRN